MVRATVRHLPERIIAAILTAHPHLATLAAHARSGLPAAITALAASAINGSARVSLSASDWEVIARVAASRPTGRAVILLLPALPSLCGSTQIHAGVWTLSGRGQGRAWAR